MLQFRRPLLTLAMGVPCGEAFGRAWCDRRASSQITHLAARGAVVARLLVAERVEDAAAGLQEARGRYRVQVLHLRRQRHQAPHPLAPFHGVSVVPSSVTGAGTSVQAHAWAPLTEG